MAKIVFPSLALACALALTACGEDAPTSSDAEQSESTADVASTPTQAPERKPVHDPQLEMALKIQEAHADDPRIIFTKAVLAAVDNKRKMLIECSLKPQPARKVCEDAAIEVYQAARADATAAKLAALGEGATPVEASDATASNGQ